MRSIFQLKNDFRVHNILTDGEKKVALVSHMQQKSEDESEKKAIKLVVERRKPRIPPKEIVHGPRHISVPSEETKL